MGKELKALMKALRSITVLSQRLHKNHLNPFLPTCPFLLSRAQVLIFCTKITSRDKAKYDSYEARNNFTKSTFMPKKEKIQQCFGGGQRLKETEEVRRYQDTN